MTFPKNAGDIHLSVSEPPGVHIGWVVLAVALFGAILGWGYLDENNYFYHVKTAHISSAGWDVQKAKECFSWNAKTNSPVLECDSGHAEVQLDVPVRFYGNTQRPLDPETVRLRWWCQKGDGGTFSCRSSE
jgi:hypothetical protein